MPNNLLITVLHSLFFTIILAQWLPAFHLCKDLNTGQSSGGPWSWSLDEQTEECLVALGSWIEIADPICVGLRVRVTASANPSGSQRVVYTTAYSVMLSVQLTQYPAPPKAYQMFCLRSPYSCLFRTTVCSLTEKHSPNTFQKTQDPQGGEECLQTCTTGCCLGALQLPECPWGYICVCAAMKQCP